MVKLVNPYAYLEEVQDFLEDNKPDHAERIARAINAAARFVDSISEHIFYRKSYTDALVQTQSKSKGNWRLYRQVYQNQVGFIKAPYRPIISGSVIVNSNGVALVEGDNFTVDYEGGKIYATTSSFGSTVGFLPDSVTVTADVGLDNGTNPHDESVPSDDIPGEIRFAALRIAALYSGLWRKAISTDGGGSVQFWNPITIPKDIMDILYLWRARA